MDPELLEHELVKRAAVGKLPKAVVPTDLYGQCCDLYQIKAICDQYGIPVVCDPAEAMGATYQDSEVRIQKSEEIERQDFPVNSAEDVINHTVKTNKAKPSRPNRPDQSDRQNRPKGPNRPNQPDRPNGPKQPNATCRLWR